MNGWRMDDDGTVTTLTVTRSDGSVLQSVFPSAPIAQAPNAATVRQRAQLALTTNTDFLALVSPTNAQVVAQVKALTRECNGLIRVLIGQLSDVSDT